MSKEELPQLSQLLMDGFGQRHGIRQFTLQGEKLSADQPAAENFIASFEDIIENGQYTLNQIFNCDETGLYYKLLPRKSLVGIWYGKVS